MILKRPSSGARRQLFHFSVNKQSEAHKIKINFHTEIVIWAGISQHRPGAFSTLILRASCGVGNVETTP